MSRNRKIFAAALIMISIVAAVVTFQNKKKFILSASTVRYDDILRERVKEFNSLPEVQALAQNFASVTEFQKYVKDSACTGLILLPENELREWSKLHKKIGDLKNCDFASASGAATSRDIDAALNEEEKMRFAVLTTEVMKLGCCEKHLTFKSLLSTQTKKVRESLENIATKTNSEETIVALNSFLGNKALSAKESCLISRAIHQHAPDTTNEELRLSMLWQMCY